MDLLLPNKVRKKLNKPLLNFLHALMKQKLKLLESLLMQNLNQKNIVEEARVSAKEEAKKIAKTSSQQLEQEVNAAREKLKADVASLSLLCAEKIITKEVDKSMHDQIINEVLNK
jgi:F-type H+-transporting ATPase subunit b